MPPVFSVICNDCSQKSNTLPIKAQKTHFSPLACPSLSFDYEMFARWECPIKIVSCWKSLIINELILLWLVHMEILCYLWLWGLSHWTLRSHVDIADKCICRWYMQMCSDLLLSPTVRALLSSLQWQALQSWRSGTGIQLPPMPVLRPRLFLPLQRQPGSSTWRALQRRRRGVW